MRLELKYIEVTQPIGSFYLTSIKASILSRIASVERRSSGDKKSAVQRDLSFRNYSGTQKTDYFFKTKSYPQYKGGNLAFC